MTADLQCAELLDWARSYDGPPFHALLCDPPYHLIQDTRNGSARVAGTGPYGRHMGSTKTKGFMSKDWDGGDVAFRPDTWAALGKHLLPGAFGMAFGGARTAHRLACAIEDAGFILHPMVVWITAQGFPKATRVDTQIDKAAGAERKVYEVIPDRWTQAGRIYNYATDRPQVGVPKTHPSSPLAATWAGHRYGLQAMKPAAEPIVVFQKPYQGKPVDCITRTGAGALWVDGARIATGEDRSRPPRTPNAIDGGGNGTNLTAYDSSPLGRWPANLCLDGGLVQVWVLRYNIPDIAQEAIRGYFHDYHLPSVREDVYHVSEPPQNPQGSVLQPGVLCERVESKDAGRGASALRQTPPTGFYREDASHRQCNGQARPGQSELQGQLAREGLSDSEHRLAAAGTEVPSNPDGPEESYGDSRASASNGRSLGTATGQHRDGTSLQRDQGRQPARKPAHDGCLSPQVDAPASSQGTSAIEVRERTLAVLACDIPAKWLRYFQPTERFIRDPRSAAAALDQQAGERKSGHLSAEVQRGAFGHNGIFNRSNGEGQGTEYEASKGGPSRFFAVSDWSYEVQEQLEAALPFMYQAKASRSERDAGLEGMPLMRAADFDRESCGLTKGPHERVGGAETQHRPRHNGHPTVKPIALTKWLATLLLPPAAYAPRWLLVPFAGVGSEMIGALLAGWEGVLGVEREAEYVEIGRARLAYWQAKERSKSTQLSLEMAGG